MSQRLTPGEQAPDFTLTDAAGEEVTLSGLRGRRVIVYFYPAAMTPGCTKQACDFSDSLEALRAAALKAGDADGAEDLFDTYLPIVRHEQQAGIGFEIEGFVQAHQRRPVLAVDARRAVEGEGGAPPGLYTDAG